MHSDNSQRAADTAGELEDAMRVPLSVSDLRYKRGLNRISKKLQKNWPGGDPLSLNCAHEILARGLGYRDFHDLQQSAQKDELLISVPNQIEARDGISTSVFAFCTSRKITGVGETDIERLVLLLPLQELAIFQEAGSERPAIRTMDTLGHLVGQNAVELPGAGDVVIQNHLEPQNLAHAGIERSAALGGLISEDGLKLIWKAVQRRGSLRDQCLLQILLQGARAVEILHAKPRDISHSESGTQMRVTRTKLPNRPHDIFLPHSFSHLVDGYIKQTNLSPDDLLFPSKRDANIPMSSKQMSRVIASYLQEALPDPSQRSIHRVRLSVAMHICKSTGMKMEEMMGHINHCTTSQYLLASMQRQ